MLNSAQSSGPVIDEIFNALLAGDGASFDSLATDRAVECSEIRALICTDDSSAVALDLNLQLKSTIYVTSVFSGPRAVFVSPEISKQILSQGEKAIFPIDHSLSFDSNFAEKLRAMFNNENIPQFERDRVIAVLMLKANNPRVQLDVLPFLYENVRLACEDVDNLRPLNTLIAFRMLDHLNWEEFRHNPSQPDFGTDIKRLKDALQPSADAFLSGLYADQSVNHMEVTTLGTQALLFRFAKLWRNNPRKNTEQILEELIQFSITKLGALPSTELSLIWCGIKD